VRLLWQLFGWLNVGLGAAGLVLPLVPTTPFLLLAAWAFARSSGRFHAWLLAHPMLGPPIHAWRDGRAIARRDKLVALAVLAAGFAMAAAAGLPGWGLALYACVLTGVGLFIATRPTPPAAGRGRAYSSGSVVNWRG
jgi:uncharacterized protein